MVWVSLGLRAVVNVEALNMVESVGNVTRHRKAAIVYKTKTGYVIRWVPVISGETIAHAYQYWIAKLAKDRGLPVCSYCSIGEFVKHTQLEVFGDLQWEKSLRDIYNALMNIQDRRDKDELLTSLNTLKGLTTYLPDDVRNRYVELINKAVDYVNSKASRSKGKRVMVELDRILRGQININSISALERVLVANCVVEDIGGFLIAGRIPIKRTSRFSVGYMVPAIDAIDKTIVEPQFHVRHAPKAQQILGQAQMPYYVEVSSAVYLLTFSLDISSIGKISMVKIEDVVDKEERMKRVNCALDALALMLDSKLFGAKLTRFNPIIDYETIIVAVSCKYPFNVSPPLSINYITETINRANNFSKMMNDEVKIFGYKVDVENVEKAQTVIDLLSRVKNYIKNILTERD